MFIFFFDGVLIGAPVFMYGEWLHSYGVLIELDNLAFLHVSYNMIDPREVRRFPVL